MLTLNSIFSAPDLPMRLTRQSGYMDMQITPAMVGAVLLFVTLGPVDGFDLNPDRDLLKISLILAAGTAAVLYGFAMHLYALGYPESPFNKHTSTLFMTGLCAGLLGLVAYRLHAEEYPTGFALYAALATLVIVTSIVCNIYYNRRT